MTVIYVTEYNCKCYAVIFLNNNCLKVQKNEDVLNDENIILYMKPLQKFIGKIQQCDMTIMSQANDNAVFDGNTNLLETNYECEEHTYIFISGEMIASFITDDKIYKYISLMDNNLIPWSVTTGGEYVFFITPHFKYVEKDQNDQNKLLDTDNDCVDPYIYHVSKRGEYSFEDIVIYKIHSNYD